VDVVPTILECAGIPIPPHLQGKSLWNQFNGDDAKSSDGALMEMKNWKSLRTERYRYVSEANGKETLIDLENDPGEYQDLAGSSEHSDELADMRANLLKKLIRVERPLPRAWVY
jgi:arylsulfatase A-like enzyme